MEQPTACAYQSFRVGSPYKVRRNSCGVLLTFIYTSSHDCDRLRCSAAVRRAAANGSAMGPACAGSLCGSVGPVRTKSPGDRRSGPGWARLDRGENPGTVGSFLGRPPRLCPHFFPSSTSSSRPSFPPVTFGRTTRLCFHPLLLRSRISVHSFDIRHPHSAVFALSRFLRQLQSSLSRDLRFCDTAAPDTTILRPDGRTTFYFFLLYEGYEVG